MTKTTISLFFFIFLLPNLSLSAETDMHPSSMHTWGATDSIQTIDVFSVYYIHQNAESLPDWKQRIEYHLRRAQKFHNREFTGQSTFKYTLHPTPFVASATPDAFPRDDVNKFYWHIINDVWKSDSVKFEKDAFPIILVFSDMNFSPGYDDWTRVCSGENCPFPPPHSDCKGWVTAEGEDRPGTRCGGARSVYWPAKHMGFGLVTADGWRVPIEGTDCVTYHEGIGHAIGLPHPEPLNHSVMALAQYVGDIHETWIDVDQKEKLGWQKEKVNHSDLFSNFDVQHLPKKPMANQPVMLHASLTDRFEVKTIHAEYQLGLWKSFVDLGKPKCASMDGMWIYTWELPTLSLRESLAFRVVVESESGEKEELWDYYKVREGNPSDFVKKIRTTLRPVKSYGHLGPAWEALPKPLESVFSQSFTLKSKTLKKHLKEKKIEADSLGGSLERPLSKPKDTKAYGESAKYFVIHDTSGPLYEAKEEFPKIINTSAWRPNALKYLKEQKVAHVFINRAGESVTAIPFEKAVIGTKYEKRHPKQKGLYLHIELVQPRKKDKRGIDAFAPDPGFSDKQLGRLALVYLAACVRKGDWLVPAFHAVIDHDIPNGHDDPQNFDLGKWGEKLKALIEDVNGE